MDPWRLLGMLAVYFITGTVWGSEGVKIPTSRGRTRVNPIRNGARALAGLVAVSGGARGQFPQSCQEAGSGSRIVERVERDRGGELRRFRPEADLQHILLANRHQRVEFGSGILFPVATRSEDHRAGLVDVPFAFIASTGCDPAAVSAPAMAYDLQVKTWRTAQVGLKGQSFSLLAPPAQQPLDGQSTRSKFHRDVSVFEAARR